MKRKKAGPGPTTEEIERLVGWLKGNSGPWIGARRFALVAVVMLARVNLRDAMRLTAGDIDLGRRTVRISRREELRDFGAAASTVHLSDPLAGILSRWLPRTPPGWVFPNQLRNGPWAAASNSSFDPHERLPASCRLAGVRDFVFRDLKEYGEANMISLAGPGSPFELGPGDSRCLTTSDLDMKELYSKIMSHYRIDQTEQSRYLRYGFEVLAKMGVRGTADLQAADFVDRYAAMVGISDPAKLAKSRIVKALHTLYGHSIRLGCFDLDLFAGRPGFRPIGRWRGEDDPPRIYRPRRRGEPPSAGPAARTSEAWSGTRRELAADVLQVEGEKARQVVAALAKVAPRRCTGTELVSLSGLTDAVNIFKRFSAGPSRLARASIVPGRGGVGYGLEVRIVEDQHTMIS